MKIYIDNQLVIQRKKNKPWPKPRDLIEEDKYFFTREGMAVTDKWGLQWSPVMGINYD